VFDPETVQLFVTIFAFRVRSISYIFAFYPFTQFVTSEYHTPDQLFFEYILFFGIIQTYACVSKTMVYASFDRVVHLGPLFFPFLAIHLFIHVILRDLLFHPILLLRIFVQDGQIIYYTDWCRRIRNHGPILQ
jgi:hypothetical protein